MLNDLSPSRTHAEPDWLARRDPVAHSPWSFDAPLTREQHETFERDGYLVLEGLFEGEEIQALQDELSRLQGLPDELDLRTVIAEPESGALRSIFAIHEQSRLFARLASDARLVSVAEHLLADEVYIHQSRLNYKTGFDGKEFYWHSDFETWHIEDGMPRMRAVSMSIQLADNQAVNGPLMLMPGSQNVFVTCVGETPEDHYKQSLRRQEYGVPDRQSLARLAEQGGIVAPTGPAGSVIVFDCNTMHGSNGNITPYPRANAFIVFNALTNRLAAPYSGQHARPEFIASRNPRVLTRQAGSLTDPKAD